MSSLISRVDMVVADKQAWRIDDGKDAVDGSAVEGAATDGASGAEVASWRGSVKSCTQLVDEKIERTNG